MKKIIKTLIFCSLAVTVINANASPNTTLLSDTNTTRLTLPKNVVGFSTPQGQELLKTSPEKYSQQYWKLAEYFTTENGISFCGPAADVMVLNALGLEPALAPAHREFTIFDQTNIFYNKDLIKDSITPARIYMHGLPLDETAEIINKQETIGAKAEAKVYHANKFKDEAQLKNTLLSSMKDGKYIIINYNRADMGASGGGHFSPLAAYNPKADMWLLMDVARYKYEPAWIKTSDLYKAIQAKDSESLKPRGIIVVSKVDG
ncbi:phytochelatin synthase [Francisella sp. Scap27]|uniref:phytochelatin synthase family protein n=1 Tax=Francisella sp. Scap27 TaxID=2589986 RepID=UPI0015BF07A6|nr:phytochelatin synthase family protein [Francisella sp. Scap27]QLE78772.1 phytochelatin synthase [Francisella sp. Scap27]